MKKVNKHQYGGVVTKTISLPEVRVYGHKPSTFDKFLSWLKNATLGAAIAENPAVATASGWHIDSETGKVSQHYPTKEERQLGNNLAVISAFSPTNPETAIIGAGVRKITPIILKAASKVKQEIPYLFPKAKLYSDNSTVNAYATPARRYNLSDKILTTRKASNVREAVRFTMSGKREAEEYINNPIVQQSIQHNNEILKRLQKGKETYPTYNVKTKSTASSKILPRDKFNDYIDLKHSNSPGKDPNNIGGVYNKYEDEVVLPSDVGGSTPFHEYLHSLGYGEHPIIRWKSQFLFDRHKNIPPYYIDSGETAVHSAQYGKDLGLKVGQPYPGDEAFDALIQEKGLYGAPFYFKRDTHKARKRFWNAITGRYFAFPLGIGVGFTQFQKGNNQATNTSL